jgi:hypothetical protein
MQGLQRITLATDIERLRKWAKQGGTVAAAGTKCFALERLIHERMVASPLAAMRYLGAGADGIVLGDDKTQRVLKVTELLRGTPALFNHVAREALVGAYVSVLRLDARRSWAQFVVGTSAFAVWEPTQREAEILRERPALRTTHVTGIPRVSAFAPFVEFTDLLAPSVSMRVRQARLCIAGCAFPSSADAREVAQRYGEYMRARFHDGSAQFAQFAIQEQALVRGDDLHALICNEHLLDAAAGRKLRAILHVLLQMLARLGAEPQRFVHMDLQPRNIMMTQKPISELGAYAQLKRPDGVAMAEFLQSDLHGALPVLIDLTTARVNVVLDDRAKAEELSDALRQLQRCESAVHVAGSEDVRRLGLYLLYTVVKRVRRIQRELSGAPDRCSAAEVPAGKQAELLRLLQQLDLPLLHIALRMVSVPRGWFDESVHRRTVLPNWCFLCASLQQYTHCLSSTYGYMQVLDRVMRGQSSAVDHSVIVSRVLSGYVLVLLEKLIHDLNPYMGAVLDSNAELLAQEHAWTPSAALQWPEWANEWAWYNKAR